MMSESIKGNERMRVMMAFQKYLPQFFFLSFSKTFSFPLHPQMTRAIRDFPCIRLKMC